MKSSFNYEFIDCLQPRCGANRGEEMILYFFSPRNMDSLCTRHVVSEGTYFRAVLSFVFKKKTRPSYDLSSRRDRPFFPPPRKIKTGPRTEIYTRARTQRYISSQTEKRTECSKWVSHGSHGKWMFCREWNMPWTSPSARGSAPLTGSDASTLESFTGLCQNLLRANVKLSSIVCLINFFFFFFIPFHVTVAHRRSRIRSRFIWIGFKWHLFFSFFFFLLCFIIAWYICIVWYFSFFSRFVWSSNACWYGRATGISIFKRRNTMENWNVVERAHEILMNLRGNEYCK